MTSIVVSGYYGFGNAGDEAILAAMIEAFTELEPNIEITVLSGNPTDTTIRHGVKSIFRLNYPAIAQVLSKSDLLVSGGGSLLQDVTSERSLYYYLSVMLMAKKLGKPIMLYGQGIGPVSGTFAKGALKYVGNMVDLITVRDEGSKLELKSLQVTKPKIEVTADSVLAMHPVDKELGRRILRKHELEGANKLIGISVREWKDWSHYKNILAEACDKLIEEHNARIVFIPMQWPTDITAARKIAKRMKHKSVILTEEYSTNEILSLTGNLDAFIGIRLHALIFAAVMHIPMVGISYDPKIDRFLETLGQSHAGTLQNITSANLVAKVNQLLRESAKSNHQRNELIAKLREKALLNAELALELIARKELMNQVSKATI